MANPDRTIIAPRFDDSLVDQIDEYADQVDATRTGVTRRLVQFGAEALIDDVLQDLELDADEREHIEATREIRDLLPGSWRNHVRDLLAENIKHGATIEDLQILARRYREQAEIKAEKAALHDEIPGDVDYTGIVDDELACAIEAADASTWDDGVENPYEHRLAGVDQGLEDRRQLVNLIETAIRANDHQVGLDDPRVDDDDVGNPLVGSILPDQVTREDVATFAERLLRDGIPPDDVQSYLLGTHSDDTPGQNGTPPVLAGDTTTQAGIIESIAATDGGPLSRSRQSEAHTDMTPTQNHTPDHDDEDESIEITRQPPAREVPADE